MAIVRDASRTCRTCPAHQNPILHVEIGLWSRTQPNKEGLEKDGNKFLDPVSNAINTITIPNIKRSHHKSVTEEGDITAAKQYLAQIINALSGGPTLTMVSGHLSQTTGWVGGGASTQQAPNSRTLAGAQRAPSGPASGGSGAQTASSAVSPAGGGSNARLEWAARVQCNQYDLGGSFSVLIFLVSVPDDHEEWFTSPHYIGSFDAFVDSTGGDRSRPNIQGFVNLDRGILKHSGQNSLESNVVVPFLTNNLHWRVQKGDGTVVELPSLEVVVVATRVSLPPGARFPVYEEPQPYPGITFGRPGGSRNP